MRRFAVIFLAVFGLVAWLSLPASAQAPRKVKMTIPVVAHSMTPVYVAQTRGFFSDEKLEIDITSTGGGGPDIRALIAGDVEFSFTTGDNVILAHQEGKRLLMVMSGLNKVFINWAMHKETAKAKGVTESMPLAEKLKTLKGLTVGVTNPGALTAHLAAFVIRKAGYNPQQDVQIIPVGAGPTWLAALENKKVDVALDRAADAGDRDQPRLRDHVHQQCQGRRPIDPGVSHGESRGAPRDSAERTRPGPAHGARAGARQSMGAQEHP